MGERERRVGIERNGTQTHKKACDETVRDIDIGRDVLRDSERKVCVWGGGGVPLRNAKS